VNNYKKLGYFLTYLPNDFPNTTYNRFYFDLCGLSNNYYPYIEGRISSITIGMYPTPNQNCPLYSYNDITIYGLSDWPSITLNTFSLYSSTTTILNQKNYTQDNTRSSLTYQLSISDLFTIENIKNYDINYILSTTSINTHGFYISNNLNTQYINILLSKITNEDWVNNYNTPNTELINSNIISESNNANSIITILPHCYVNIVQQITSTYNIYLQTFTFNNIQNNLFLDKTTLNSNIYSINTTNC